MNVRALLFVGAAMLTATLAQAQDAPLANPSTDELRALLSAPAKSLTRSFVRTAPPSTDGACGGVNNKATEAPAGEGGGTRSLGVVPYAGAGAATANLAIQFANASDAVAPPSRQMLDRLAALLKEPDMASRRFAIAGHTDATGSDKVNLELSCARAIAVRAYLLKQGVAAERLSAYGFGSSKPLQEGAAESAVNRRVEVRRAE